MTRKIITTSPDESYKKHFFHDGDSQTIAKTISSIGMDKFRGEYYHLNVDILVPFKNQARQVFHQSEIDSLAETIEAHGVRQPLTVLKRADGKYEVVSGERRLRAAKSIGLTKVPCIIIEDADQAEEISLIENIQRSDLHPIDLANGLKKLIDKIGWGGQTILSKKIGMQQSHISEYMRILELPEEVKKIAIELNYTGRDKLSSLLKLSGAEEMIKKIKGDKNLIPKEKEEDTFSLLRLSMTLNEVKVQKSGLKKLGKEQRFLVIEKLQEIVNEIEKMSETVEGINIYGNKTG